MGTAVVGRRSQAWGEAAGFVVGVTTAGGGCAPAVTAEVRSHSSEVAEMDGGGHLGAVVGLEAH